MEKIMQNFINEVKEKSLAIEGIAIGDEKKVLAEYHFQPDLARNIYSHTKSYMSTAVGIAVSEGKLQLTDRLVDFFPECVPENVDERMTKITLRDLLVMSSGFGKAYLMNADRRNGVGMPDYIAYMMGLPMEYTPGEKFAYSTADSYLAGRMVEKAVGKHLGEYLYEVLFSKLGQGWPQWENCPMGHPIGGGGMSMHLTEMMKLGQLYLANGQWNGEQLVDPAWIKEATRKQIDTPLEEADDIWRCGYGYQFWLSPYPGSYRADGAFGQITTVLPASGLVVAVQCPEVGDFEKVKQALHDTVLAEL